MVHRKSCYTLTFKTIGARDRRNLYEENLNNRYLYEAIHRFHQPLPFEEEPCDCDVHEEEQQKHEHLRSKSKAPKRAQSQPRPTSSRPSTEPRLPVKSRSNDWPLSKPTSHGTSSCNNAKTCAFCGCDFALFRSPNNKESAFDTTYHDDFKLMHSAGGPVNSQESNKDALFHKMEQCLSTSKVKLEHSRPHKTRFEDNSKHSKKDNRRTSTEDKEEGIRGVLKCHPILREFDLLPATMKPYRAAPDGSPYWNSQGDRVSESEQYHRTSSGAMVRNTRQCSSSATHGRAARLSASTGNLTSQQTGNSGGLRRVNSHGWRVTNTRDTAPHNRPSTGGGDTFSQVLRHHSRWSTGTPGGQNSATPAMQWRCPGCDRTATVRS